MFISSAHLWRLGCLLLTVATAEAAKVYYVNQPENGLGQINVVSPDGTNHTTVYTTSVITDLRGIAADTAAQKLYFVYANYTATSTTTGNRTQCSLQSIPMAGGALTQILSFPDNSFLADVEWDPVGSWIYYAMTGNYTLHKVQPNGSSNQLVLTHIPAGATTAFQGPYFFGLDLPDQRVYYGMLTDSGQTGTAYSRATLAGTIDSTFSITTNTRTRDIAIDSAAGRAYWCDRQDGNVYTRLISGGANAPVRLYRTFNAPHGLALDVEAGKGYLADTGKRGSASEASSHRVARFNLDGSGAVELLSPVSTVAEPWDLALDMTSTSYADWKTRFFASNALFTGINEDADGDGIINGAEYVFFTRPDKADGKSPAFQPLAQGIRFARRNTSDVLTRIEVSTDLISWNYNGDGSGQQWTTESGTTTRDEDSVWVNVSKGNAPALNAATRLYFRLRAITPAS
jgi:hypothetical protein